MHLSIVIALSFAFPPADVEPCFGVTADKIGVAPTYRLNGRPIPAHVAYDVVDKGFDDDGRRLRLTFIGPAALRGQARKELEAHAEFAELRQRFAVRDFAPDHWALKPGFVTSGQPTIYCQAPDGKVLHRQDDFAGGADELIAALRQANANYDPRRDPDLRPSSTAPLHVASVIAALAVGAGASHIARRRFSKSL